MANMFINAMTDVWNSVGTTFSAIKMSVTDTASAAGSKLIDLRGGATGTTNLFSVDKAGNVVAAGTVTAAGALGLSDFDLASGSSISWNVAGVSDVTITHSPNALAFAGAVSGYTFDSSVTANTLIADTNINVGSAMVIAEGKITFPPTQIASANVNCLDDYEEGSWSASVAFTGASTGVTYTSRTGYYTKIGNRVFFTVFIRLSAKGSSTGSMSISLPPFTILNTVSGIAFAVGGYIDFTGLTGSLSASASGGGSTCSIQQHGATGTADVTHASVTATTGIAVSGSYPVN